MKARLFWLVLRISCCKTCQVYHHKLESNKVMSITEKGDNDYYGKW